MIVLRSTLGNAIITYHNNSVLVATLKVTLAKDLIKHNTNGPRGLSSSIVTEQKYVKKMDYLYVAR